MDDWDLKPKTAQQEPDTELQTPDGQEILVGASVDQILIVAAGFNNWEMKAKIPA
jgi:hypothetical protein